MTILWRESKDQDPKCPFVYIAEDMPLSARPASWNFGLKRGPGERRTPKP